jgi:hypothetical protein
MVVVVSRVVLVLLGGLVDALGGWWAWRRDPLTGWVGPSALLARR